MLQDKRCQTRCHAPQHYARQAASDLYYRDSAGTDGTRNFQEIVQHDAGWSNNRPMFVLYDFASTV